MKNEKLISIIIPCYNVQEYLERCIKSLLRQTIGIKNLELIFINDASTDDTWEILNRFEQVYPNSIILINLENNLRQGGARNVGMQYASAGYIGFVDSDDWVEPDMYEKLYCKAIEYNCDIVGCDFKRDINDEETMGCTGKESKLYKIDQLDKRRELMLQGMRGGIWSKLYKKDLLINKGITFPEHLAYEDNYFYSLCYLYAETIYQVEEYLYHYCIRYNSTVSKTDSVHQLDRLKIELMKLEEYKDRGIYDLFQKEIECVFLRMFYLNTLHTIFLKFSEIPYTIFLYMQNCVKNLFPEYNKNPYITKDERKWLETIAMNISQLELEDLARRYQDILKQNE